MAGILSNLLFVILAVIAGMYAQIAYKANNKVHTALALAILALTLIVLFIPGEYYQNLYYLGQTDGINTQTFPEDAVFNTSDDTVGGMDPNVVMYASPDAPMTSAASASIPTYIQAKTMTPGPPTEVPVAPVQMGDQPAAYNQIS